MCLLMAVRGLWSPPGWVNTAKRAGAGDVVFKRAHTKSTTKGCEVGSVHGVKLVTSSPFLLPRAVRSCSCEPSACATLCRSRKQTKWMG